MTALARRLLKDTALASALLLALAPAPLLAADPPPLADLIGRWDDAEDPDTWFAIAGDADGAALGPERLTATGSTGEAWAVDPHIPYMPNGSIWMTRYPKAAEMDAATIPAWARRQMEGTLQWRLRLAAAQGELGLGGYTGDVCKLTLSGSFYPGSVSTKGPRRDPATGLIAEEGGTAEVATGPAADAGREPVRYVRHWYDPPAMKGGGFTFNWSNPDAARSRLGYAAGEAIVIDINNAAAEAQAYGYYREFIAGIFKAGTYAANMVGVGGVVQIGAEGLVGAFAQNVVEAVIGKAIVGDDVGRQVLVEAFASTAASALVGRLVHVDPNHLEQLSGKLAEDLGAGFVERSGLSALVKAKAAAPAGQDRLTDADLRGWLEEQFTKQCRFQLLPVKLARGIAGIMVADRGRHTAELVLYVPADPALGKPSAVVRGSFGYLTAEGLPPQGITVPLDVLK